MYTGVLRAHEQRFLKIIFIFMNSLRMSPPCRQRHLSGYRSRTRTLTLTLKLTATLTLLLTLTRTLKLEENNQNIGQHMVIFMGYFIEGRGWFIRGP